MKSISGKGSVFYRRNRKLWVAQYYDSMGFAVNEEMLAKKLAGIAYVAVFNNEDTRVIQSKAKKRAPYNGTVAIYCKGGKERIFSFYLVT